MTISEWVEAIMQEAREATSLEDYEDRVERNNLQPNSDYKLEVYGKLFEGIKVRLG
jgi:hypothetical protein